MIFCEGMAVVATDADEVEAVPPKTAPSEPNACAA